MQRLKYCFARDPLGTIGWGLNLLGLGLALWTIQGAHVLTAVQHPLFFPGLGLMGLGVLGIVAGGTR